MISPGDRVTPSGNHSAGTVLRVDGSEVLVLCDCGHRGTYALESLGTVIVNAPGDRCGGSRTLSDGTRCPGCRACS